jgi:hypothetical protein
MTASQFDMRNIDAEHTAIMQAVLARDLPTSIKLLDEHIAPHHPHVHMIAPCGGISPDGRHWVSCRPGFFLPVRVLSRLFRRLFLEKLIATHQAGRLSFFGDHAHLADAQCFEAYLAPQREAEWVVYSKRPFGGPEAPDPERTGDTVVSCKR